MNVYCLVLYVHKIHIHNIIHIHMSFILFYFVLDFLFIYAVFWSDSFSIDRRKDSDIILVIIAVGKNALAGHSIVQMTEIVDTVAVVHILAESGMDVVLVCVELQLEGVIIDIICPVGLAAVDEKHSISWPVPLIAALVHVKCCGVEFLDGGR